MKLLFCIDGLYNSGGMEKVLIDKVNYFVENYNYTCIIITTEQKNRKNFFKINKSVICEDLGINYLENNGNIFKRTKIFFEKQSFHRKELQKKINKFKPDIVISCGGNDKFIIPKLNGKHKTILEHHFEKNFRLKEKRHILYKLKELIFLYKEKKLISKYNEFLVLTEEDKKQWKNHKIKVIGNALPFYPQDYAKLNTKKIISVGRLEYQKGYDILVEVWKNINKKHPEWTLEIYGEGSLKKYIEEKIDEYNLKNSLYLMGTAENIVEKYLDASLYIMTSRWEGFGMVLIEAKSCGLPVIAFDCPCGPRDIIFSGEDGYLCKLEDINEMVQKITVLIENIELRKSFGEKARKNVLKFKKENIMLKWRELFENLLK